MNQRSQYSDALIVGGGIVGLSIARKLKQKGIEKITILEKNPTCGNESSNAAAGMLAPQAEAARADSFFNFCRASRDSYPKFAAELFDETGIDVELNRTGTLYLAFNQKETEELEKRFAWQTAANLPVEKLTAREILKLEPNVSPEVVSGLLFPQDWQVENRKVVAALYSFLENKISIHRVTAESLLFKNEKVVGARTANGDFRASFVIIATGAWTSLIKDRFDLLANLQIAPVRGQIVEYAERKKTFRHVVYAANGYAVPRRDNRILVGATVENVGFDCQTTSAATNFLMKTAKQISPAFDCLEVKNVWAGLRPHAPDALPVLGEFPGIENLFAATGHYRNGILLAPLTAEIVADKITGGIESEYLKNFSPQRFAKIAQAV